jgi:hypothetical protein
MDRNIKRYLRRLMLERLKPWVVVFYSPVLLLAVVSWLVQWFANRSRYSSVLPISSPYPFSELFKGFFSTDCSDAGSWGTAFWGDNYGVLCMIHVQLISAWLLTAGYALTPSVRKRILPLFVSEHPQPLDDSPDENRTESTMTETTETK